MARTLAVAQFAPHDGCPDCGEITEANREVKRDTAGRRHSYRCAQCRATWTTWWAYSCATCGARDDLTVDHIWPRKLGGTDNPHNLRILCRSCNSRKGADRHTCPSCGRD